jgi:hypothetical protein
VVAKVGGKEAGKANGCGSNRHLCTSFNRRSGCLPRIPKYARLSLCLTITYFLTTNNYVGFLAAGLLLTGHL